MTEPTSTPVAFASVAVAAPRRSLAGVAAVGFVLLGITGLGLVGVLFIALGPGAVAMAGLMALIPLGLVLLGIRWIDRWEPEPRWLLLLAFLWGAAASVLLAIVVALAIDAQQAADAVSASQREIFGTVVEAPLVEEFAKGLGVLLVFLLARRHFNGPVDGVVYAATVAAGFAFSENILYFGAELLSSGGVDAAVVGLFVVRGLMSPFAHVMFTTCIGLAIGIASRRGGVGRVLLGFFIGLVPAVLLHMVWNGATYVVGTDNFFGYYFLVQFPLFIGAIVLVVQLRKQESRATFDHLSEYAAAGWFTADELSLIATPEGRRQAIVWATSLGRARAMKTFIRDATHLAFARDRIRSGRDRPAALVDERLLLDSIVASRAQLTAPASGN